MAAQREALMRVGRRLTRQRDLAEELVQETMARALSREHLFTPGTNLGAWLRLMMTNLWRDELRRRRPDKDQQAIREELRRTAFDVEEYAVSRQAALDVLAVTAALSQPQRQVVALVGLRDLSYAQAADVMGITRDAAMSCMYRARRKLRALIPQEDL